jgi:hypothetical protein
VLNDVMIIGLLFSPKRSFYYPEIIEIWTRLLFIIATIKFRHLGYAAKRCIIQIRIYSLTNNCICVNAQTFSQ